MRRTVPLLLVVLIASMANGSTNDTIGDTSYWTKRKQEAVVKGIADAKRDFSNGVYRIATDGIPGTGKSPYEVYLETNYKVTMNPVAGCCGTATTECYMEGYNARMKELLLRKLGKDVFEDAESLLWNHEKPKDVHPSESPVRPPGDRPEERQNHGAG